ncbi:MAG: CNNM domain-containing protein [Candidatus Symbiodolus clandestinus]
MQEISTTTLIIVLGVMLILSAYFSASETGMMALNRYRLRHLAKQGHRGAQRAEKLLQRPDQLIGLILIGNTVANSLATTLAALIGQRLGGDQGVFLATALLTLAILIFGETGPKSIAAFHPERVAFPSSWLLRILHRLLFPLVSLLNHVTQGVMLLFGLRTDRLPHNALSKEELRTLFHETNPLIPHRYQEMLRAILDLETMTVEDVMIPCSEIVGMDINDDWKSLLRQLLHCPYNRLLLYRDNLDNAVGLLRVREAYRLMIEKNEIGKESLLRAADEIYFIPEGTPLHVQLMKFQRNKESTGIVVDEYGDIKGLVTVQAIVEEIVGDFTTSIAPSLEEEIVPQADGSLLIAGSTNIRDLNKILEQVLPVNGPRTLNGLLLEHLETIPAVGTRFTALGYQFEILAVAGNRITQVKLWPISET